MSIEEFLPNPAKRDWGRILRDLARVGIAFSDVAAKCNRNPTTVGSWAEGIDPKDTDARIVLSLYAKHCPIEYLKNRDEFEVRPPPLPPAEGSVSEP